MKIFKEKFNLIAKSPETAKLTDVPMVRIKIIRDYLVSYRISSEYIEILAIWDSRRNPKNFKL